MKLFLKILGSLLLIFIAACYICFLFVLPKKVDINAYLPDIKTAISENSDFNLDVKNLKLYTNPLLSVGVKAQDVSISYEDGDEFIKVPNADIRIAPLSMLLFTVKSPSIVLDSPTISFNVPEGKQLKLLSVIEDMMNRNVTLDEDKTEEKRSFFNPKNLKIKLSKILLTDYTLISEDGSNSHNLKIKGEKLLVYYDKDKVKFKTNADFENNENKNISSKLDVAYYLKKKQKDNLENDPAAIVAFPYINPVRSFEKMKPKANVDTKIKIRRKSDKIWAKGYLNIDDYSANFSGYELPKSYLHAKFRGYTVNLDTDLSYAENQRIKLNGNFNYGNGPWVNVSFLTDKLYFNDMLKFTKALMDTYKVKNNIDELVGSGYLQSDLNLKTNFKNLDSKGRIDVVNGSVSNKNFGKIVADINGLLEFNKREMKITKTKAFVNEGNFKLDGNVDDRSNININVELGNMPLTGIILKFAPKEIRENYRIKNGLLSLNADINGKLSKPFCILDATLDNLLLKNIKNNILLSNANSKIHLETNFSDVKGKIKNRGLRVDIPSTNSQIKDEDLTVNISDGNIVFEPSNVMFNNRSLINFLGEIQNYKNEPNLVLDVFGAINTSDIDKFLGPNNAVYMASKGILPLRIFVRGNERVQDLVLQIISNSENYYTPINIKSIMGKTCLTQANLRAHNGVLNVKNTGLYLKGNSEKLTSDHELNAQGAKPVIEAQGTIIGLQTSHPSINILKLWAPEDLNINFALFKNSSALLSIKAFLFGTFENVKTSGKVRISKISIPEIKTSIKEIVMGLDKSIISLDFNDLLLDNSDINITTKWNFQELLPLHLHTFLVTSNYVDVDRLMVVMNKLTESITPKTSSQASVKNQNSSGNIPIIISSGNILLKRIKTGSIIVENTRGVMTLKNNVLSIKNIMAQVFKGNVFGSVDVNLVNKKIAVDMKGSRIDVAKALLDTVNAKDALTGTASFKALLTLISSDYEEQIKSMKGAVEFNIKNGSFGPIGKLENLILAENIRESQFFQTALGGIIDSLATIDTAHFETLEGIINLNGGIANIQSIKSTGNVLSFLVFGNMDILENELDVKLRGRMASNVSDMLGPIAILNPVNLIKQTPGVNLVFAQAFTMFTVPVTKEELDELPSLSSGHSDENATGIQVVLRGDVNKPLKLVKSFKWLASTEDMERAQAFMKNILQLQKDEEEAQARRDRFNVIKKIKNAINKDDE